MLTDAELLEMERLVEIDLIERRRESLNSPVHEWHTKNYSFVQEQRLERAYNDKGELISGNKIVVLEGSARSGKTISFVDDTFRIGLFEPPRTIFIIRGTYAEFKTTLYNDYKERLDYFDLPNPFHDREEVKSFKVGNARITFLGADKMSKKLGAGSDYVYFNEVLFGISEHVFKQLISRCSIAVYCDYNPAFTKHWFYDKVLNRPDCGYLRTTFLDNKYCPPAQRAEILSSEPWESGSYKIIGNEIFYDYEPISETNQPPINEANHIAGTADEDYWRVYGLGLRGAMKGRIFKKVQYQDHFPDIAYIYGNDFGFTNDPNATVKLGIDGDTVYIKPLIYHPIDTAEMLDSALQAVGVRYDDIVITDSSDRFVSGKHGTVKMVNELYELGYSKVSKVSKTKSKTYWITRMKSKRIVIAKSGNRLLDTAIQNEFENLIWKAINGIEINTPDDTCDDHFIDAALYCFMAWEFAIFKVNVK